MKNKKGGYIMKEIFKNLLDYRKKAYENDNCLRISIIEEMQDNFKETEEDAMLLNLYIDTIASGKFETKSWMKKQVLGNIEESMAILEKNNIAGMLSIENIVYYTYVYLFKEIETCIA